MAPNRDPSPSGQAPVPPLTQTQTPDQTTPDSERQTVQPASWSRRDQAEAEAQLDAWAEAKYQARLQAQARGQYPAPPRTKIVYVGNRRMEFKKDTLEDAFRLIPFPNSGSWIPKTEEDIRIQAESRARIEAEEALEAQIQAEARELFPFGYVTTLDEIALANRRQTEAEERDKEQKEKSDANPDDKDNKNENPSEEATKDQIMNQAKKSDLTDEQVKEEDRVKLEDQMSVKERMMENEIEKLRKELQQEKESHQKTIFKLQKAENQLTCSNNVTQQLKHITQTLEDFKITNSQKLGDLEKKLDGSKGERNQDELKKKDLEISNLQRELAKLYMEKVSGGEETNALKVQMVQTAQINEGLMAEVQELEGTRKELEVELEAMKAQDALFNKKMTYLIRDAQRSKNAGVFARKKLEAALATKDQELMELRDKIQAMDQKFLDIQNDASVKLEAYMKSSTSELVEKSQEVKELQLGMTMIMNKLDERTVELGKANVRLNEISRQQGPCQCKRSKKVFTTTGKKLIVGPNGTI